MSQETKPYRTNVHLTFPPTISGAPLVCNLTRLFDLDFNISTAQITPRQEGFLNCRAHAMPATRGSATCGRRAYWFRPWRSGSGIMRTSVCNAACARLCARPPR